MTTTSEGRRIVIAGTMKDAKNACREKGWAPPGRSVDGKVTYGFAVTQPHRLRGFRVRPDDEVIRGYFPHDLDPALWERFEWNWKFACLGS